MASELGCLPPRLDGVWVGEVAEAVGALAVEPSTWAEVCGQPVPQLVLEELIVENMHSASTEPGTISSARTAHCDRL